MNTINNHHLIYLDFFKERGNFFDTDAKKATFLIGILYKKIIVPKENSLAYISRFSGRMLTENHLREFYKVALNQMTNADRFKYFEIDSLIDAYLSALDDRITNDIVGTFFKLGLTMDVDVFGN